MKKRMFVSFMTCLMFFTPVLSVQKVAASVLSPDDGLTISEIRSILQNEGIDDDLIEQAINNTPRSGNNINNYMITYFAKSSAYGKNIRVTSKTFYNSDVFIYPVAFDEDFNPYYSVAWNNTVEESESISTVSGGHTANYQCTASPVSTGDGKLFSFLFYKNTSNASTASIYNTTPSSVKVINANGTQTTVNWSNYIEWKTVGLGDVDLNGNIGIADALAAIYIKNNDPLMVYTDERAQRTAADVNGDSVVDQDDVDMIMAYIAGIISTFLPEDYD